MSIALSLIALIGGLAVGLLHFALLRRSTAALVADGAGGGIGVVSLAVLRFALTGAAAWVAVQAGAGAALALLLGFLVARHLSLRRWGRP